MVQWLLFGVAVIWLGALAWIIQDAIVYFPRAALLWWGGVALVLGPLALPLYLSERMSRRAQMNKMGHGKAAFVAPEHVLPFRSAGDRRFAKSTLPGSGVFVSVREGPDAHRGAEIPANGELIIRRATAGEIGHSGVLTLHDEAVSREEHCRIVWHKSSGLLYDDSRWGTIVDGR